jgi:hypothetical protein
MSLDAASSATMESKRAPVALALRAGGKDADGLRCKKTGISALKSSDRAIARTLFKDLGDHGIFIVPVGELESWLPGLGVPRSSKAKWIVDIFSALGSSPKSKSYVKPSTGDVWKFFDDVGEWIRDPNRLGLP